jgi:SprT-like family
MQDTADRGQEQLKLFSNHTEHSLRDHFEKNTGQPVSLVLTENSTTMLSVRPRSGVLCVRLHRMFLNADPAVLGEIASFLVKRNSAMPRFREFVRSNREQLCGRPPNRISVKPRGKFHDLGELHREINNDYFEGAVDAAITWGSRSPRYSVKKRTLGSYNARSNLIRINPALDRKTVPRYFIAYIVYHEMLHAALGAPMRGSRRSIHSREFRKREQLFKDYEKALAWERG